MQFTYQTNRLVLKVLQPEYADKVCRFYQENKQFLEPFEPLRPPVFYTKDFHHSNLVCECNAFLKLSYLRYWLFLREEDEVPIGTVCFNNIIHSSFQKCMLGYKLGKDYCHHGYMLESLSLLIPLVMKEIKLHRMEAYVQPNNLPSIKLLSKLGFVEEGYLQKYAEICGEWTDHLIFSYLDENL